MGQRGYNQPPSNSDIIFYRILFSFHEKVKVLSLFLFGKYKVVWLEKNSVKKLQEKKVSCNNTLISHSNSIKKWIFAKTTTSLILSILLKILNNISNHLLSPFYSRFQIDFLPLRNLQKRVISSSLQHHLSSILNYLKTRNFYITWNRFIILEFCA